MAPMVVSTPDKSQLDKPTRAIACATRFFSLHLPSQRFHAAHPRQPRQRARNPRPRFSLSRLPRADLTAPHLTPKRYASQPIPQRAEQPRSHRPRSLWRVAKTPRACFVVFTGPGKKKPMKTPNQALQVKKNERVALDVSGEVDLLFSGDRRAATAAMHRSLGPIVARILRRK
jgi:hypothetical protein